MYEFFSGSPFFLKLFLFFQGIYLDIVDLVKNANPYVVIVCFAVSAAAIYLFNNRILHKSDSIVYAIIAGLYFTFLLSVTLFGREPVHRSSWNMLFHTYTSAFDGNAGMRYDILFNVFLYIPIGILLSRYRKNLLIILCFFILTVVIEFVQLGTSLGVFEISDIINNFIGGLIGLGIARLVRWIIKSIKSKRKGGRVERAE